MNRMVRSAERFVLEFARALILLMWLGRMTAPSEAPSEVEVVDENDTFASWRSAGHA